MRRPRDVPGRWYRKSRKRSGSESVSPPRTEDRKQGVSSVPVSWTPPPEWSVFTASVSEWSIGQVLLDLYEVTDIIGEGGMGVVYKVHHRGWDLDLAVKSPKPRIFRRRTGQAAFVREAQAWVSLALHPHTVSCHYVRTIDGVPRLFAEYVDGGSLSEWIQSGKLYRGGPEKALRNIVDTAIQFAWGLQHAHDHGLIHQDVKPANVMMAPDGIAKVTDFGLSRASEAAGAGIEMSAANGTRKTVAGMTPAYCSPEQACGEAVGQKSDMWSWALSLLEMFVGEMTWSWGPAAKEILDAFLETGTQNPVIPPMPGEIVRLLERCFDLDPAGRPESMGVMAAELRKIHEAIAREPYPRREPVAADLTADDLNNRALSHLDLRMVPQAMNLWKDALQRDKHHVESLYNRGLVQWRAGMLDDQSLVNTLQKCEGSSPVYWLGDYALALVHLERDDNQSAIELLEGTHGARNEFRTLAGLARERLPRGRRLLESFEGHTGSIDALDVSSDGLYVVTGGNDRSVRIWDLAGGHCLWNLADQPSAVCAVRFSLDGRFALGGFEDGSIRAWDLVSGERLEGFSEIHEPRVTSLSFSLSGERVLSSSSDGTLKLWEFPTGRCIQSYGEQDGTNPILDIHLEQNEQLRAFVVRPASQEIWNLDRGEGVRTVGMNIRFLRLCSDRKHVLSTSLSGELLLSDIEKNAAVRTFRAGGAAIRAADASKDGRFVLAGSSDDTLRLWAVATGRCLRTFDGGGEVTSVQFAPDGRIALSGTAGGSLMLWHTEGANRPSPYVLSRLATRETRDDLEQEYIRELENARHALT